MSEDARIKPGTVVTLFISYKENIRACISGRNEAELEGRGCAPLQNSLHTERESKTAIGHVVFVHYFKGTVPRDFDFRFFFMNQFSPSP